MCFFVFPEMRKQESKRDHFSFKHKGQLRKEIFNNFLFLCVVSSLASTSLRNFGATGFSSQNPEQETWVKW